MCSIYKGKPELDALPSFSAFSSIPSPPPPFISLYLFLFHLSLPLTRPLFSSPLASPLSFFLLFPLPAPLSLSPHSLFFPPSLPTISLPPPNEGQVPMRAEEQKLLSRWSQTMSYSCWYAIWLEKSQRLALSGSSLLLSTTRQLSVSIGHGFAYLTDGRFHYVMPLDSIRPGAGFSHLSLSQKNAYLEKSTSTYGNLD